MFKRFLSALVFVALLTPAFTSADTLSDLQALLAGLQAQIKMLEAALVPSATPSTSGSTPAPSATPSSLPAVVSIRVCPSLVAILARGSRGEDVANLQGFLAQEGAYQGEVTAYFGPLTEAALQRWQAAQGIVSAGTPASTGWGVAGPKTRAFIKTRCGAANPAPGIYNTAPPVTPPAPPFVQYPIQSPASASSTAPRAEFDQSSLSASNANPTLTGTSTNVGKNFFLIITDQASSTAFYSNGIVPVGNRWSVIVTQSLQNGYYLAQLWNDGKLLSTGSLRIAVGDSVADLKVNGTDGPITIVSGSPIVLSWILRGVSNCTLPVYGVSEVAGAAYLKSVQVTNTYKLSCTDKSGKAIEDTVVVNISGPDELKISTSRSSYTRGESITVSWNATGANYVQDWVALVPAGMHYSASTWPNSADAQKFYTGGIATSSHAILAPQSAGTYEVVLYLNDTFTEVARSAAFTVGP